MIASEGETGEGREDESESKKFRARFVFSVIPCKDSNEDHETDHA